MATASRKNLIVILAVVAAFMAGASACALPAFSGGGDAKARSKMPDPSAVPHSGLGVVQEAYDAIPHRRTVFSPGGARMPVQDKHYLRLVFRAIDEAVVSRVSACQALATGESIARHLSAYDDLIDFTKAVPAPRHLAGYQRCLTRALQVQRSVLQQQQRHHTLTCELATDFSRLPEVQESSSLLKRAYSMLMERYPNQNERTRQSFFDYHCALDFI